MVLLRPWLMRAARRREPALAETHWRPSLDATAGRRRRPFLRLFLILLLLAGVEMLNTLWQNNGLRLGDAIESGLLVFSLFGLLALLAGLLSFRGAGRRVVLAALHIMLAALSAVLFLSWLTFLISGHPINADAMRVLVGSPLEAGLHLLSSSPLLLLTSVMGLGAFLYGMSWLLRYSLQIAPLVSLPTRAILSVLLAFLAAFAVRTTAATENSRSSYAAFLGRGHAAPANPIITYSCPRSPDVPIVPLPVGMQRGGTPVIVLMIESLRSDLMTTYSTAMPNLAHFATESMVFDKAYATASHSDYEDLSFWYSRYPFRAYQRMGYPRDADWRGLSVFEYFKHYGYSTAYFSSQNEKWGDMVNWLKIPAVDTYFDSENFTGETWANQDDDAGLVALIRAGYARAGKVEDSQTLDLAAEWIEKHSTEPFFIGLNLQNTHYNYFIPTNGARPYKPDELGFRAVYSAWPKDQAGIVRNRYLNAAYNVDAAVGRFAQRLERAGIWDRAVVLVVGDGGEAFYEHGFGNHSGPMYEEVARTLAMIKLPKGDARNGKHWRKPVSHIDFVPALIDIVGMDGWEGFQGVAPWNQLDDVPVYMSVNALAVENSVLRWPWKLMVRSFPERSRELYNLETDPSESHNEFQRHKPRALEMLQDLNSWQTCQIGYYADGSAYHRLQPPRYTMPEAQALAPTTRAP